VAGQQIRLFLPEKMGHLKNEWGYKTLKELMLASEFFDISEEPLKKEEYVCFIVKNLRWHFNHLSTDCCRLKVVRNDGNLDLVKKISYDKGSNIIYFLHFQF
jgi:hypothetical protein